MSSSGKRISPFLSPLRRVEIDSLMSLLVASMAVFKSEDTYENYEEDVSETFAGQWLFEEETEPGCSGNQETTNCRDASIEEIFHVITSSGIGGAYPSDYSDCDDSSLSTMQQEMDIARGGHFDSVPTMPFIIIMIKLVIIVAKGLNWTEYVV